MLGVGGTSSVSEKHQLAAAADRFRAGAYKAREGIPQHRLSAADNVVMFRELRLEKCPPIPRRFPYAANNCGTRSRLSANHCSPITRGLHRVASLSNDRIASAIDTRATLRCSPSGVVRGPSGTADASMEQRKIV